MYIIQKFELSSIYPVRNWKWWIYLRYNIYPHQQERRKQPFFHWRPPSGTTFNPLNKANDLERVLWIWKYRGFIPFLRSYL